MTPKPVIIIAFADYRTNDHQHLRALGDEQDEIVDALRNSEAAGLCDIDVIANATVQRIMAAFNRHEGRVVGFHYAGHAEGYQLLLQDDATIEAEGFAQFLGRQPTLKFVFLNACATVGHASTLHRSGIPIAIITEAVIRDDIARAFAVSFYQQLAAGKSIINAFNEYQYLHEISGTAPGSLRGLDLDSSPGFPWQIRVKPGAEAILDWNLPQAAKNYLFNLDLPEDIPIPNQPFLSLNRFERQHARIFFGRGKDIRALANKVIDKGYNRVLLFYGQSGVGKSSLLDAGLLPRLSSQVQVIYLRRTKDEPIYDTLTHELKKRSGAETVPLLDAWQAIERQQSKPLLVILDQIEEIFTRPIGDPSHELQALIHTIKTLFIDNPHAVAGKILLSYRKEYHGDIEKAFESAQIPFTKTFIERLDRDGIHEAIVGVASDPVLKAHFKLHIDANLPTIIADDLQDDQVAAVAPVLQILLDRMWQDTEPEHPHFSVDQYRKYKSQGILLHDFMANQFDKIGRWNQSVVDSGLALDLLFFFTTPFGTADIHLLEETLDRYGDRKTLVQSLIDRLVALHLLSILPDRTTDGQLLVRLAHDTLVPPIHSAFERSNLPGQNAERLLSNVDLRAWKKNPERFQLNAEQVHILKEGRTGMRQWLPEESELIRYSQQVIQRRSRNRKWLTVAGIVGGLIIMGLLAFLYRAERQQRRLTEAASLEAQADLATNPTQKRTLLEASLDIFPNQKERIRKLAAVEADHLFYEEIYTEPNLLKASFSADGRYLAMETGEVETYKVFRYEWLEDSWQQNLQVQSNPGNPLNTLQFTPSGDFLFGGGTDRQLHLWKLNGDSLPMPRFEAIVNHTAYDENLQQAIFHLQNDGAIKLWNTTSKIMADSVTFRGQIKAFAYDDQQRKAWVALNEGRLLIIQMETNQLEVVQRLEVEEEVYAISILPKLKLALMSTDDGRLLAYDLDTQTPVDSPFGEVQLDAPVQSVKIDTNKRLALLSTRQVLYLFRLADRKVLYELIGHEAPIIDFNFGQSPDHLFTIDANGHLFQWQLPVTSPKQLVFKGLRSHSVAIAQNDDDSFWITTTRDSVVFGKIGGTIQGIFDRHQLDVVALDASENIIISGDQEGAVYVWSIANPAETIPLDAHYAAITDLAIGPNRELAMTAAEDGLTLLWSLENGTLLDTLPHDKPVQQIAWASDLQEVWTYALDGKVRTWSTTNWQLTNEIDASDQAGLLAGYPSVNGLSTMVISNNDTLSHVSNAGRILQSMAIAGKGHPLLQIGQSPALYLLGTEAGQLMWVNEQGLLAHRIFSPFENGILDLYCLQGICLTGDRQGHTYLWEIPDTINK